MKAITLRLEDEDGEALRRLAFDRRLPQNEIVRRAVHALLTDPEQQDALLYESEIRRVCDIRECERPNVMTTTPGGLRFCEKHRPHQNHTNDGGER